MPTMPPRKPDDARKLYMTPLSHHVWPITYTWLMDTAFGPTQQTITVDAPLQALSTAGAQRLGRLLWQVMLAPAITSSTSSFLFFMTQWMASPISTPVPMQPVEGQRFGPASRRDDTPQIVMLTGHVGDSGKRRLFLPGAPRSWSSDGQLVTPGWENIIQHCRGLMMGFGDIAPSQALKLLIAYPDVIEPEIGNPGGVAFREVRHLRVCSHTDKAPEASGIDGL